MNEAQAARIIELLESIDASLKRKSARVDRLEATRSERPGVKLYMEAIVSNIERLAGRRMTAQQIAATIGVEYDQDNRSHRIAFGHALTEIGATKQKSGSVRYYNFT